MGKEQKLHLTEKAGFVIFSVVGCLFLILGFLNIKSRLLAPFKLSATNTTPKIEEQNIEALKLKDTDHDGLSDYDEIYLYNTSPYIADTDSDGIPDGEEVKQGTDPNCPKDKTCLVPETAPAPVAPAQATPNIDSGTADTSGAGLDTNTSAPTVAAIRDALKQQGVDQATLDKFDDATLLKMYEDAAKTQSQSTSP